MSAPLVSVIVPCFRQGHLLAEAVESALNQQHSPVEIIVINDGSDDDTEAVAKRYGSQILYLRQPNRGLCAARNAGIRAASGRYVLFLDADDLLHPLALEWLVECMNDREDRLAMMGFRFFSRNPSQDAADDVLPAGGAAWFARTFDLDPLLRDHPHRVNEGQLEALPYFIYTNFGPPHCFLCSRPMLRDIGMFDEELSGCADWDVWLRLSLAGAKLVSAPHVGAYYRRYEGSMSTTTSAMLADRTRVLLKTSRRFRRDLESYAHWAHDLLQAARRVRRRFVAYGVVSPLLGELQAEIRFWSRLLGGSKSPLGAIGRIGEGLLGTRWDRFVLARCSRVNPELHAYYLADID